MANFDSSRFEQRTLGDPMRETFIARRRAQIEEFDFGSLSDRVQQFPANQAASIHVKRGLEAFSAKRFDDAETAFDKARMTMVVGLHNIDIMAALCAIHASSMWFCKGVSVGERVEAAQYLYQKAFEIWSNRNEFEKVATHKRQLAAMLVVSNRLRRARTFYEGALDIANSGRMRLHPSVHTQWIDEYQTCFVLSEPLSRASTLELGGLYGAPLFPLHSIMGPWRSLVI